jgi:hypothetical protein
MPGDPRSRLHVYCRSDTHGRVVATYDASSLATALAVVCDAAPEVRAAWHSFSPPEAIALYLTATDHAERLRLPLGEPRALEGSPSRREVTVLSVGLEHLGELGDCLSSRVETIHAHRIDCMTKPVLVTHVAPNPSWVARDVASSGSVSRAFLDTALDVLEARRAEGRAA